MSFSQTLASLKAFTAEVELLQGRARAHAAFDRAPLIRLALHQLIHGPMRYERNDPRWERLAVLAEAGELSPAFGGGEVEVLRGTHVLTTEDLVAEAGQPRA